jgi:hypothetical protein
MWFWWICAELMSVVYRLWFRIRVRGKEHVPRTGGVLIVCNHLSNFDPPMLGWASRPRKSFYMGKKELFDSRVSAWMISSLGASREKWPQRLVWAMVRSSAGERVMRNAPSVRRRRVPVDVGGSGASIARQMASRQPIPSSNLSFGHDFDPNPAREQ